MNDAPVAAAPVAPWRAEVERDIAALPTWRVPATPAPWYLDIDPARTRYSRPEFVTWRNEAFVEQVYRALLKRGPDVTELHSALVRLAAGEKEVVLIGDLLASPEARATGVKVRGISSRYRLAKVFRLPVVGGLIERLYLMLQMHTFAREQRLVEERVTLLAEQSENYTARAVTRLQAEIERLQRKVSRMGPAAGQDAPRRDGGAR